MFLLKHNNIT